MIMMFIVDWQDTFSTARTAFYRLHWYLAPRQTVESRNDKVLLVRFGKPPINVNFCR